MKSFVSKTSIAALWTGGFSILLSAHALALNLADKPLILPTPMMPNVILTVEESSAMRKALPPYVCSGGCKNTNDDQNVINDSKRYYFSHHYNPLYYNPDYIYEVPKKPDGSSYSTSYNFASLNGYDPNQGSVDLHSKYRPTYSFNPANGVEVKIKHPTIDSGDGKPFPSSTSDSQAYYYVFKQGCHPKGDITKESCYELKWVGESERSNFANWYSFYRTRYLESITALHLAMPKLEGKIRLAWQGTTWKKQHPTLSDFWVVPSGVSLCYGFDGTPVYSDVVRCRDKNGTEYDNNLDTFTGKHKENFYKWLSNLGSVGLSDVSSSEKHVSTSMRASTIRAGKYLENIQRYCDNPKEPHSGNNPARSCRDNIHIIVSDGERIDEAYISNDFSVFHHDENNTLSGEVDSKTINASSEIPVSYTPRPPYMDLPQRYYTPDVIECYFPYKNTPNCQQDTINKSYYAKGNENERHGSLADAAMYFWIKDLVPSLDNDVIPNMNVTSGATQEAIKWNPRNDPANWQHMVNYFVISGVTYVLGDDYHGSTYDAPHARGEKNWPSLNYLFSHPAFVYDYWHAALNSRGQFYGADRADELVQALKDITNRIEKRLAASAAIAANSTRLDTGAQLFLARYIAGEWSGELIARNISSEGVIGADAWQASIPPTGSRNIVVHDGSAAQALTATSLLPADWDTQTGVAGATADEVLAWLRGDQADEQTFDGDGNPTGGKYRKRSTLLGDIVNSDPVYVDHQDYGYASLPEGAGDAYKNFVTANKDRVKMLYVGANDGMLHGFAAGAGTGTAHACGATLGQEVFAYIPNSARKMLPTLANPDYGRPGGIPHRYYVDGPAYAGDAFIGGQWRTILLSTTGAGGRTIFALDVTNPCDFDAGKVLWELDESWDADLGYTLAKPIIARLNDGKWAAVFGNGYNSGNGKAVLFVVNLQTGALIKKFDLGGTDNGLASPSLYDADGNGTTDYVYAGDLEGKLWKFDLSSNNDADWAVAYGGSPLFEAVGPDGYAQPITAAPELGDPMTGVSGVMVYFGTGRFFAEGDQIDTRVQSLYGLLDKDAAIGGRSDLLEQSITSETVVDGKTVRKSSQNAISYESKRGWYIDLNHGGAKGERVVSTPDRKYGRIFNTVMAPSTDPCKFAGTSWLMELDPYSGAMPESSVIDVGGEVIAGVMSTVGVIKRFEFLSGANTVAVGLGSTVATEAIRLTPSVVGMNTGRVSWREIID